MPVSHDSMANAIRALSMDAVEKAKSGHPGLPMGAATIATALFTKVMKYDMTDAAWPDRDRFVLSAGHGSMLLYSLLHLTGESEMTMDQLRNFRVLGSRTPGHPEFGHTKGVETTTGPLGQGLATAVGMALAERMMAAQFGDVVDHRTYVLCSDGDLMEGISQEAIAIAGHLKLSKLIVFFDDNGISIDGPISIADSVDQLGRFKACGWNAVRVDGHDPDAILAAAEAAQKSDKPTLIACRTTIGYGAPTRAGTAKAHGEALGAEEIAGARKALDWPWEPFVVPPDILEAWRSAGRRGGAERAAWQAKVAAMDAGVRAEFERRLAGRLPAGLDDAVSAFKQKAAEDASEIASRKASEAAIGVIAPIVSELILGSADLTGSNNNKVACTPSVTPGDYSGRFVHWGVREHAMAAAVNGMSLHGGLIPSGATFLAFADYCRPSLRLAALMRIRAIQVMTHDSIGLGEDGPTHQPVEHLASLRAIPNLLVFRPADRTETIECWQLALQAEKSPSILALSRQNLPQARTSYVPENLSAGGAYELRASEGGPAEAVIFASGSEVGLALEAHKILAAEGRRTRVVSTPCLDLFLARPADERQAVIGDAPIKIAVEAGSRLGWDAVIGADGIFIGMSTFGESGPYKDVYKHFGITTEAIVAAVRAGRA